MATYDGAIAYDSSTDAYGGTAGMAFFRPKVNSNFSDITSSGGASKAWTRSGTTATITDTLNNMTAGDIISVTVSSDTAAIPLGDYTVQSIGSGVFTITCLNDGGASGTITYAAYVWYDAATNGNRLLAKPDANSDVTITRGTCTCTGNEACIFLTVSASQTLNIATYNFVNSSLATILGTIQIGISADTGWTTAGIDLQDVGIINVTTTSKINNSGMFDAGATARTWLTTNRTGIYVQTGNGNCRAPSVNNQNGWISYTLNEGVTANLIGTYALSATNIGTVGNTTIVLNGIIQTNGNIFYMSTVAAGSLTIGANFDYVGTGSWHMKIVYGTTWTNNKTGPLSGTGIYRMVGYNGTGNVLIPNMNTPLMALYFNTFNTTSGQTTVFTFDSGTHYYRAITTAHQGGAGATCKMDASVNNPNLVIAGGIDLNANGSLTLSYVKGTGTWTLGETSGTINFRGASMESIVVNDTIDNATKTNGAAFTTVNMTITKGIWNGGGFTVTGTGQFLGDTNGKIICTNTNGLIHASGTLTGFAGYTYNDGFTVESQNTVTWDGTVFPSSANINYIMNGNGKTMSLSTNYTMKSLNMPSGALKSTVDGTPRTITRTNTGIFNGNSNVRDIWFNLRRSINAKTACTNLGNNLGIVFKDKVGMVGE